MSGNVAVTGNYVTTTTQSSVDSSSSTHSTKTNIASRTQETVEHILTDDRHGSFGALGTANYAGKLLSVRLVKLDSTSENYQNDFEEAASMQESIEGSGSSGGSTSSSSRGGAYGTTAVSEEILAASTVSVTYATTFASPQSHTESISPGIVTIDLCPYTTDYIVPGSVRFTWMGQVYEDFDGVIYRGRTASDVGVVSGQLDYSSGIARMTDYVVSGSPTNFMLNSLWTQRTLWMTSTVSGRTQSAPVAPSGFAMQITGIDGTQYVATAGNDGLVTGAGVRGKIDYLAGLFELNFGDFVLDSALTPAEKAEWWYSAADVGAVESGRIWRPRVVDPRLLRYNAVTYFYLPLDAEIIGLDPVRLPQDGRVPIYRVGSYVVVGHTGVVGPAALSAGQTINCGRVRLSRVQIVGSDGQLIQSGWTADLEAGTVTAQDVAGWVQPVRVRHRIEEMARVSDVQINGQLTITKSLTHEFPIGSIVSNALMTGTLRARVSHLFDQSTWTGRWQDTVDGSEALASYNDTLAPIVVTNAGALSERWMLRFTSTTNFDCIGEHVGVIGSGSVNTDFAPINPISGVPYLIVRALGWGLGWAPGNLLRINTVGAMQPYAAIRTVQPSEAAGTDYRFELTTRGNVDRLPSTTF